MIAAIPWSTAKTALSAEKTNAAAALSASNTSIDKAVMEQEKVVKEEKESASRAWRSHSGRACWLLELLLEEYTETTKTRIIQSKFIKLLVIALRTSASSGGDERTVLRLLRIYGRTRQLRKLDTRGKLSTVSNGGSNKRRK